MTTSLSRRTLLAALGGAASALPLLNARPGRAAGAPTYPTRLLVINWNNGVHWPTWHPPDGPLAVDAKTQVALGPLVPFSKKLLLVGGLELKHMLDTGHNNGHQATPFLLTAKRGAPFEGTWDGVKHTAGGPSIDQHVAQQLKAKGVTTKFPSLVLRTAYYKGNDGYSSISGPPIANKVNAPMPEHDPVKLFDNVLGDLVAGSPTAADAARRRAMGKSALDYVAKSAARLAARLGTEDRLKLQAHLDGVRELETRIATVAGPAPASCAPSRAPTADDFKVGTSVVTSKIIPLLSDIVVSAFTCGLTRVANIGWGAPSFAYPAPGQIRPDDKSGAGGPFLDEHGVAHAQWENTESEMRRTLIDRWFCEQLAYALGKLDAVKEGDGTLLDHTVVLFANQMGDGAWHTVSDLPWIIAGGGSGFFKTGRVVRYPGGDKKTMLPSIRLLRSIASAFGLSSDGFADPAYGDELAMLRA